MVEHEDVAAQAQVRGNLDSEGFIELWDSYSQAIFRYCFRRTAERESASDLVSIVFLEAWRRRDRLVAQDKGLPWLYGIATNVLRNQSRSRRRHAAALRRLHADFIEPDFSDSIVARIDDEAVMRDILVAIRGLSDLEQDVLALCIWQGLSPKDASLALDVPEVTVRTRLHRARNHLRAAARGSVDQTNSETAVGEGRAGHEH
jgi:RNA polymerase sigma factor (sigma-70 family)